MRIIGNVRAYDDDEEIIDILKKLPPSKDFENLNILRYMQTKTPKADFGAVISFEDVVYTVYKFDIHLIAAEDAGLLMTVSDTKYADEQLRIWLYFRKVGMSFSEKIFAIISNGLVARKAVHLFHSNRK